MELIRFPSLYACGSPVFVDARTIASLIPDPERSAEVGFPVTKLITYHNYFYAIKGSVDEVAQIIKDAELFGYPIGAEGGA